MTTRRDFLRTSAVAGGAILTGGTNVLAQAAESALATRAAVAPLNVLVFGGTGYIGPHLVRGLVARGHKVTIFNRGRREAELPSNIDRLVGDRAIDSTTKQGNLKSLEGKRFDAVIDDPASDPRWVRQAADLLKTSGSYLFVSSTGVYLPYMTPNADETAPVGGAPGYGRDKAECEKIVMEVFGDRGQVVRPAYIIGPGDTSFRFPYWPQRLKQGGETLAPGKGTERIAIVDVRDLSDFMIKLVEDKRGGIYNVTGPKDDTTFAQFLDRAQKALKTDAKLVWVDDYALLAEQRVGQIVPWTRLDGDNLYHTVLSNKKAVAAGLKFRPMEQTILDVWEWWPERLKQVAALNQQVRFQITPEREQQVLAAWKAKKGG